MFRIFRGALGPGRVTASASGWEGGHPHNPLCLTVTNRTPCTPGPAAVASARKGEGLRWEGYGAGRAGDEGGRRGDAHPFLLAPLFSSLPHSHPSLVLCAASVLPSYPPPDPAVLPIPLCLIKTRPCHPQRCRDAFPQIYRSPAPGYPLTSRRTLSRAATRIPGVRPRFPPHPRPTTWHSCPARGRAGCSLAGLQGHQHRDVGHSCRFPVPAGEIGSCQCVHACPRLRSDCIVIVIIIIITPGCRWLWMVLSAAVAGGTAAGGGWVGGGVWRRREVGCGSGRGKKKVWPGS